MLLTSPSFDILDSEFTQFTPFFFCFCCILPFAVWTYCAESWFYPCTLGCRVSDVPAFCHACIVGFVLACVRCRLCSSLWRNRGGVRRMSWTHKWLETRAMLEKYAAVHQKSPKSKCHTPPHEGTTLQRSNLLVYCNSLSRGITHHTRGSNPELVWPHLMLSGITDLSYLVLVVLIWLALRCTWFKILLLIWLLPLHPWLSKGPFLTWGAYRICGSDPW